MLQETVAALGDSARAVALTSAAPRALTQIVDTALSAFGRLDVCVNNAAVAPHAALLDERVEVWDTVFAVNCRGTFLMTQAAGRALIAQGSGGRIINFSSGVTTRGSAGAAAYRAVVPRPRRSAGSPRSSSRRTTSWSTASVPASSTPSPSRFPRPWPRALGERIPERCRWPVLANRVRGVESGAVAGQSTLRATSAVALYCVDGASGVGSRPGAPSSTRTCATTG